MNEDKEKSETKQTKEQGNPVCTCMSDPFASLPPDLRPILKKPMSDLRNVTCPGCGLVYWTNRKTDVCIDCEKKGVHQALD